MARVNVTNRYKYTQPVVSATWSISHGLNIDSPIVDVWIQNPTTGSYSNSDAYQVTYIDSSNITIEFNSPVKGIALII
ncbi:MAG: hypothetical protein ACXW2E_00810 [Nitrososphaeraceae archaeon]